MILRFICTTGVFVTVATAALGAEFHPRFNEASLQAEKVTYRRVRVQFPWREEYRAGERRLVLEKDTVSELSPAGEHTVRKAPAPDGARLRWLGAVHDIAFFAVEQNAEQVKEGDTYIRAAIRRLDLKKIDLAFAAADRTRSAVEGRREAGAYWGKAEPPGDRRQERTYCAAGKSTDRQPRSGNPDLHGPSMDDEDPKVSDAKL